MARSEPRKVAFPQADDVRILRAAVRVRDEGIAEPLLIGPARKIDALASGAGLDLAGLEVIDPQAQEKTRERFAATLESLRRHKGMSLHEAENRVFDPNMFACLMVREGLADAVLGGLSSFYPETIRPALQVLDMEEDRTIVSSLYIVHMLGRPYFFTDCAVNIQPTSAQLAEIAAAASDVAARQFGRNPRVAFISYSDFGSAGGDEPARVRAAVDLFHKARPDIPADGEMQADTAVVEELLLARRPDGPLRSPANVLVFPTLTAANASYKLLNRLGEAEVIGPILSGLCKSVHVLQRDASVSDIVNMTAIAATEAQRKG